MRRLMKQQDLDLKDRGATGHEEGEADALRTNRDLFLTQRSGAAEGATKQTAEQRMRAAMLEKRQLKQQQAMLH